jgi:hypothetical protein
MKTYEIFKEAWNFHPKERPTSLGEVVIKFSEKTSLQSDPYNPVEFYLKDSSILETAFGCMAVLYSLVLVCGGRGQMERIEKVRKKVESVGRYYRFQGKWADVGALLHTELNTYGMNNFESKLLTILSTESLFGNLLPLCHTIIERNLGIKKLAFFPKDNLSKRERLKGVKRPIRRRGYNDHGSLKLNHEHHETGPDWSLDEKEQELQKLFEVYSIVDSPPSGYFRDYKRDRMLRTQFRNKVKEVNPNEEE